MKTITQRSQSAAPILVIGYGNTLRGDDAVGLRVAERVAGWDRQDVRALAAHQLTPEMAEMIARARLVIFVDAQQAVGSEEVNAEPLEPADNASDLGHIGDPRSLLALAHALYGRCPEAWLIGIPAPNMEIGERLSSSAEHGVALAVEEISRLIARREP